MRKNIIAITILVVLVIASILYIRHWRMVNDLNIAKQEEMPIDTVPPPPPPQMMYGFIEDSFHIERFKVQRNQNLASILMSQDVNYSTIHQLAENSKEIFDVRRIRTGNPYTMFFKTDSLHTPAWFVYEINQTDYVVMELDGNMEVYRDNKPVEIVRKTGTGVINSSLWNAMGDNNLHPTLAIELSEIYAWTVDFFGIEKGDSFKIIYDEAYVDSTSIGVETIHAAHFSHKRRDFFAFHFKEDSVWSFFDEEGNSLRKAFLKAPLKFSRISSRFSNNRFHPVLRVYRPHHGVDYAAPAGTPVYAIGDGTVINRGWDPKGGGNFIRIRHNSIYTSLYMHLQGFAKGIRKGNFVQQGELIGYVGRTGLATGPHLDFRMFKNGQAVDPLKIEAPPVDPIQEENMEKYLQYIKPLMSELKQIYLPREEREEGPIAQD